MLDQGFACGFGDAETNRQVAQPVVARIEYLEAMMARFETTPLDGLRAWQPQLVLLQTIPGIDAMGAAMLLVEIGLDMTSFGSAQRLASWAGICPGNNEATTSLKISGPEHMQNSLVVSVGASRFCGARSTSRTRAQPGPSLAPLR